MYQKFIFNMLMQVLGAASPNIVEGIRISVEAMVKAAAETKNPWDDMAAGLLQMIVGRPKEPLPKEDE